MHSIRILASAIVFLSAVLCQHDLEVHCEYRWGGSVCDCQYSDEPLTFSMLNGNHRFLEFRNCHQLIVPTDALIDLAQLNILRFGNISELTLHQYSFNSTRHRPSIRIEFSNCTIKNLPSHFFKGVLDEFVIKDSTVNKIEINALTGIFGEITNLKVLNSTIGQVDTQAFRKLTIQNLEIINTTFLRNLVSKTFYDCHVKNIAIEGSRFTQVMSSTFDFKEVEKVKIESNSFGFIESEAFMMDVADRAFFNNNTVEMLHRNSFKGIVKNENVPRLRTGNVYFEFHNNQINFIHPIDDMSFSPDINLQMSKLYFRDPQNCEGVNQIYETKFFNENAHAVYLRLENEDDNFNSISYLSERCQNDSKWFMYLLIAIAVVVFLTIMIPAVCCYLRTKKRKEKQLDLVMPEPRTYRQTQIIMQIENTGLIKTDF